MQRTLLNDSVVCFIVLLIMVLPLLLGSVTKYAVPFFAVAVNFCGLSSLFLPGLSLSTRVQVLESHSLNQGSHRSRYLIRMEHRTSLINVVSTVRCAPTHGR